ncbi:MAG: AMP-binding protein, partial [Methylocella sp.]
MSDKIYPVAPGWKQRAYIDKAKYLELYAWSVADPDSFWAGQARRIDWIKPFTRVKNTSFGPDSVSIKWFEDGTTNVAQNCIDRHLPRLANHTAIIFEGDDPAVSKHITYQDLHDEVCRLANVLKAHGVEKGDTVTIYLPMIPEAAYAMLACARIGAVHSVVFGGFAAKELATRIEDAKPKLIFSASCGLEPGRIVQYKPLLDEAIALSSVKPQACITLQRPQRGCDLIA